VRLALFAVAPDFIGSSRLVLRQAGAGSGSGTLQPMVPVSMFLVVVVLAAEAITPAKPIVE
jgi:hypothetical protein